MRDLTAHKGYANAALLSAIRKNETATADSDILSLMQHILVANRFWLLSCLGKPFDLATESRNLHSWDGVMRRYQSTHVQEMAWLAAATENELVRRLSNPLIPGGACLVSEALMQVFLHSQGHRAQCAKLLRRHGGQPPVMDFISWAANRPIADWPQQ
jgi:uncharacterized damage-inducible protein DinB